MEWAGPLPSGSSSSSSFGSPAHQHSALVAVPRGQVPLRGSHLLWNLVPESWRPRVISEMKITAHVGNPASRTIVFMLEQMLKKSKCGDFPGGPLVETSSSNAESGGVCHLAGDLRSCLPFGVAKKRKERQEIDKYLNKHFSKADI